MICCEEGGVHIILPKAIPTGSLSTVVVAMTMTIRSGDPHSRPAFPSRWVVGGGDRDHSCTKELVMYLQREGPAETIMQNRKDRDEIKNEMCCFQIL